MFLRVRWLLFGLLLGMGVTVGGLKYHVVRAEDGWHFVPKVAADLNDPLVDIRKFELTDWDEHPQLAAALLQNEQGHLIGDSSLDAVRRSVGDFFKLNIRSEQEPEPSFALPFGRPGAQ